MKLKFQFRVLQLRSGYRDHTLSLKVLLTPMEELGGGLKELKGPYLASMGGEVLGPVKV